MKRFKAFRSGPALACAAWLTVAVAAVLGAAPPAAAQSPAQAPAVAQQPAATPPASANARPTSVSPLTVLAPPSRAILTLEAREFVDSYAQPTKKLGLLARWTEVPACLAIVGLVPEQAVQFKTRIEAVAKAVKAPVAKPKCKPNIQIVFTTQPQRYLDAAVAKSPAILGAGADKKITRPIQAWYATADGGAPGDGIGPLTSRPPPSTVDEFKAHLRDGAFDAAFDFDRSLEVGRRCIDPDVVSHTTRMIPGKFNAVPDRIETPTYAVDLPCLHSVFMNVLIIVDVAHMGDVSVDTTSDYLALLALAQPKPLSLDGCLALPSVLDLYAINCPGRELPTGLTPADRAYLTGLYVADVSQVQLQQSAQTQITGRMVKILDTGK